MSERLRVRKDKRTEWVTLDRPERLNALDEELADALVEYFEGLPGRVEVRVVVLSGRGRGFCSGLDSASPVIDRLTNGSLAESLATQRKYSRVILAMRRAPQIIVALLQGAVSGAGFAIALAADIRIANQDMWMNAAFIRIGLSGCDMGSSYLLPRLIGTSAAANLLFSGRRIDASRAHGLGLVSEVVLEDELERAGLAIADDLLASSPLALRMTKACFYANVDASSFEAALELEDRNQILLARGPSFREGVDAFRAKRGPMFEE